MPPAVLPGIAAIVQQVTDLDPSKVAPDKAFVRDLGIDSISMLEIIEGVAVRFGVRVRDEDAAEIKQVVDLVSYVETRRNAS